MSRFGRTRPTKLALVPHAAGVTLFGLSALIDNRWLLLLAGAAFGLTLAALVLRPRVDGLTYLVQGPTRTAVGEQVTFTVHVHNTGTRTTTAGHVTHGADGLDDVVVVVPSLPVGRCAIAEVQHTATARAATAEHRLLATSSMPFGLRQARAPATVAAPLIVHPPAAPPAVIRVSGGGSGDTATTVVSRSGLDVHGIRDYRPGDAPRQVHWRSTARRGRLVVLDREEQRDQTVVMIMAGAGTEPEWEPLVARAASTSVALARSGTAVTLVSSQPGLASVVGGAGVDLLDWFAGLSGPQHPADGHIDDALHRAGRGGTLVVAATSGAPQAWWTWLRGRAAAAQVVLVALDLETR